MIGLLLPALYCNKNCTLSLGYAGWRRLSATKNHLNVALITTLGRQITWFDIIIYNFIKLSYNHWNQAKETYNKLNYSLTVYLSWLRSLEWRWWHCIINYGVYAGTYPHLYRIPVIGIMPQCRHFIPGIFRMRVGEWVKARPCLSLW